MTALLINNLKNIKMILTKELDIKWAPSSKKYYEEKGYKFTKLGDTFTVKVEDLSRSSHHKVKI